MTRFFNEVYDKEHVPNLSKVTGVLGVIRHRREILTMNIGASNAGVDGKSGTLVPKIPGHTPLNDPIVA